MNASTSSSLANFEKPLPKTPKSLTDKSSEGPKFSNAHIFPSLHPMGNFYREKIEVQPRPAFQTPKTAFKTPKIAAMAQMSEPVKKIKTNENTERIQEKFEVKELEDSFNEEENKKRILNAIEEFPVPKLPARLNAKKDLSESKKAKINDKVNKLKNVGSLVVKDPVSDILEVMQKESIEMIQEKIEIYQNQLAQQKAKKRVLEYANWLSMVQDQAHLMLGLEESVTKDEALIGMNENSVSIHMRQNISEVLKACHQSQERLAQFLKANF